MSRDDLKKKLKKNSVTAAKKADEILDSELNAIRTATVTELAGLRPQITDSESYEKLITAVEKATSRHESLAALKSRLERLGEKVISVAKKAAELL